VSLYQGKAEQILPLIEAEPDCVILDPPRSGLKMEASMGVIEKSPNIIIYISCNPSTLARDMKYLILGGYKVASSTLVDMFPQTFHIESVTLFIKENV
jgi:23S rRNA (uracil1939-C5)-methyltransferase